MEAAIAAVGTDGGDARDAAGADGGSGSRAATTDSRPPRPPGIDELPESLRDVIAHGHARVLDFQDERYAALYADRVGALLAVSDLRDPLALHAVTEASRRLALWMAYEDVAGVADLKTRRERFRRIQSESAMQPDQNLKVSEYLKPGAEELADIMPVGIGRRIMARVGTGKGCPSPLLGHVIHVRSNGVWGYRLLRLVASLERIRRRSLRYRREQQAIEEWLRALAATLPASAAFAGALAELPRVRKGYSDTMQRGLAAWSRIVETLVRPALSTGVAGDDADRLRRAIAAAMADERHSALDTVFRGEDVPGGVPVAFTPLRGGPANVH